MAVEWIKDPVEADSVLRKVLTERGMIVSFDVSKRVHGLKSWPINTHP